LIATDLILKVLHFSLLNSRRYLEMPSSTVEIQLDSITTWAQPNGLKSDIPLCEISDSIPLRDVHDEDKVDQVQKWNQPRTNVLRLAASCWGFMIMGMNDAAIGV
jgi:hypothetical protein